MSTPKHYWQLVVLDQSGNTVDFPQADVASIRVSKQLNGGSGEGTITFNRYFNDVGAIGFSYQYLLYIWNSNQPKPTSPYWAGVQMDPEQIQLNESGQVAVTCYGDFTLLNDSIVSLDANPGIDGNPSLDAASLLSTLLTGDDNFNPPSTAPYRFTTPSLPSSMFSLSPVKFTHEHLGTVIDNILKTGRDTSGAFYTWFVSTSSTGQRQIVVRVDQNPNLVSGVNFRHLFVNSDFDTYKITTKYRDIINVLAVYGYQDPNTGSQPFGVYSDATSISQLGRTIEGSVTVPWLMTTDACQQYAQIYFDLNAFPVAQGSFRLLNPDYTIDVGTWVQLWESPAMLTDGSNASIKQVRCSKIDVTITKDRVEQVVNSDSPAPYLDKAIYRLGGEIVSRQVITAPPAPHNLQQLYIRAGGTLSASSSNPAKIALTACEAIFPNVGIIYAPALALTQLTDNSGGANNGKTGSGQYTVSVNSSGSWIITKGDRPANTATQQNVLSVMVSSTSPTLTPYPVDIRTLSGQPAFSNVTAPTLKTSTTVTLGTPTNNGSGAFDQPVDFWLDPATWASNDPSLAYLEMGSAPHGASTVASRGKVLPTSDGHYTPVVAGLGAGSSYDIYVRAHDNNDRATPWLLLGTTSTYTLNVATMPKMPAGASFTASSITLGSIDAGFKTLSVGGTAAIAYGVHLTYQFTINESNSPVMAKWGVAIRTYLRSPHSSSGTTTASNYSEPFVSIYLPGGLQNGSVQTGRSQVVTPGNTYDIAIDVVDNQGNATGLVYLGQVTVPKVQSGSPIGPVISKGHFVGSSSSDITTSIYDNTNDTLGHGIMSAGTKSVINSDASVNASHPNLLPGTDFASFTGTRPLYWQSFGNLATFTRSADSSTTPGFGTQSLKHVCSVAGAGILECYPISGADGNAATVLKANSSYVFSMYIKMPTTSGYNITTTTLSGLTISALANYPLTHTDGAWHRYAFLLQVGSADVTLSGNIAFVVNPPGAGFQVSDTIWFAAPKLEAGSILSQWTGPGSGTAVNIDFGLAHSNKTVDNIADGSTYARVKGTELASGTVKQLNDGTNVRTAATIAGVIDASGNILSNEFGGKLQPNGSLTAVDGNTGATALPFGSTSIVHIEAVINAGVTSAGAGLLFGNSTNGYYLTLQPGNVFELVRYKAGTPTAIASTTVGNDTAKHRYQMTISFGSGSNVLEGSIDSVVLAPPPDSSPPTITSPATVTVYTGGSSGTLSQYGYQLGNQHYGQMHSTYRANFNNSGQALASTMFNSDTPNIPSWTTDVTLEYSSSGSSPNITMKFWYDNGTAGTDAHVYNPDGSSVNVGHTTSASPSATLSSLSSSQVVYYLVYYNLKTSSMVVTLKTSAFTLAQINAAYADGGYVAFNATTSTSGTGITAGGSGGISGGGGGSRRY